MRFIFMCAVLVMATSAFGQIIRPGDELRPGINVFGQQEIEGELAFVIYSNINGEEDKVYNACDPYDTGCDRGVQAYSKKVEKITCGHDEGQYYCYLSKITGLEPVDIKSEKLSHRLYETLVSTPTPIGFNVTRPSMPTGYSKTVVGVSCTRSRDNEFKCYIEYRQ